MSADALYPVPDAFAKNAHITKDHYDAEYRRSIEDPEGFWGEHGKRLDWIKPYSQVKDVSYTGDVHIKWYADGTLNVAANCVDRHLAKRGDQAAIIWEGDDPNDSKTITYRELHEEVCRFANALKARGVKKGDRVTIYLPMIPEAATAMLACARIGAVHSIVFGGFSPEALAGRIEDCAADVVITSDEGLRGGRKVPLKKNTDEAIADHGINVSTVFVVKRTGGDIAWTDGRDVWWHEACAAASPDCPPEEINAEDPLFI
ncbi:MAG: AMP-binding protein, partial [Pseudomonadota bacterium]